MQGLYFHYQDISIKPFLEVDAAQAAWRQQIANLTRKAIPLLDELAMINGDVLRFNRLRHGNSAGSLRDLYRDLYPESWRGNATGTGTGCSIQLLWPNGDFQSLDQFMASLE